MSKTESVNAPGRPDHSTWEALAGIIGPIEAMDARARGELPHVALRRWCSTRPDSQAWLERMDRELSDQLTAEPHILAKLPARYRKNLLTNVALFGYIISDDVRLALEAKGD